MRRPPPSRPMSTIRRTLALAALLMSITAPLIADSIPEGSEAAPSAAAEGANPENSTNATTVEKRVAASADDAEEIAQHEANLTSSDLDLIHDGSDQTVGIRWAGLSIPKGATITAAYVQFTSKESRSETTKLSIRGQAADNAPAFTKTPANVSARALTSASVNWAPAAWSQDQASSSQRTPDLRAVIQEIVNRSGWASGNALAMIITGSGQRSAWSYDGKSSAAALLHVEFTAGGSSTDNPPSATLAVYAGYYDTHHGSHLKTKPSPWRGSSSVVFAGSPDPGTSNEWDSSCIRIDNLTSSSISGVSVTVTMGSKSFALWGTNSIPAGKSLILAQTGFENFDGSDTSPAGCYGCNPNLCLTAVSSARPSVRVTIDGKSTYYVDSDQILNTKGVDGAGCPYTGSRNDESYAWERIYPATGTLAQGWQVDSENVMPAPVVERSLALAPPAPNPSRGDFAIELVVPKRGTVRLAVYDAMGRLVKTYFNEVLEAGEYRGRMNITEATSGTYFLRLSTEEGVLSRRIILVR